MSDGETDRGNHVALVSGGMDSAVAAHVSVRWGPADLLSLDTGTGLDANREYVEEFADAVGAQLWTLRTQESYADRVETDGFPGPPSTAGCTGSSRSDRSAGSRLSPAAAGTRRTSTCGLACAGRSRSGGWRTSRPSKTARGGRGTRRSTTGANRTAASTSTGSTSRKTTLWDDLGRSGDCFCGCFGSPEEKIDLEAAGHVDHADWLRNLERDADADDERGRWAWGALTDAEARAERIDAGQMTLCSTCGAVPTEVSRNELSKLRWRGCAERRRDGPGVPASMGIEQLPRTRPTGAPPR